ncbi:MAG: hypothetical protein PHQ41_06340 [Candidatus Cloacimonetes bacterium]|jgi:hypothetical protein|nr:hypothetical protein [Candidatus Cloacimonadota bacterium]
MIDTIATLEDLKSSLVYGSTGGYLPSGKDCTMRSCNDLRTIIATASEVLELMSKSKGMEVQLIGTLSSSRNNCLTILDQTEDFPYLDEVIRRLDNSEIIDLKHWEWLDSDHIFFTYGLGEGILQHYRLGGVHGGRGFVAVVDGGGERGKGDGGVDADKSPG